MNMKDIERKVKRYPNDCWSYPCAPKSRPGIMYGGKRMIMTHYVLLQKKKLKVPPGMQVNHKCDNARCVNPDHLYIGTQADNMDDAYRRIAGFRNNRLNAGRMAAQANREIRLEGEY